MKLFVEIVYGGPLHSFFFFLGSSRLVMFYCAPKARGGVARTEHGSFSYHRWLRSNRDSKHEISDFGLRTCWDAQQEDV
jgi:hypothetical protein